MDSTAPLQSIAALLATLADEAIEPLLVTFDALVETSDTPCRPQAAALLRETAAACDNSERAKRLLTAADAVEAGRPAALTAEGQTWREAALTAGETSVDEWKARAAASDVDAANAFPQEPLAEPVILDTPPPRLPRLRVRHFFRGLVVRLRREVVDTAGHTAPVGQRLEFLSMRSEGPEGSAVYHLDFAELSLRLDVTPQDDRSIIGNGGNGWFQPVPVFDCLTALWRLVDGRLQEAEDAIDDEDGDQVDSDMLLSIRTDVDDCGNWLTGEVDGDPPHPECAPVAAEYFGKDSDFYNWANLLFAAIPYCQTPEETKPNEANVECVTHPNAAEEALGLLVGAIAEMKGSVTAGSSGESAVEVAGSRCTGRSRLS